MALLMNIGTVDYTEKVDYIEGSQGNGVYSTGYPSVPYPVETSPTDSPPPYPAGTEDPPYSPPIVDPVLKPVTVDLVSDTPANAAIVAPSKTDYLGLAALGIIALTVLTPRDKAFGVGKEIWLAGGLAALYYFSLRPKPQTT